MNDTKSEPFSYMVKTKNPCTPQSSQKAHVLANYVMQTSFSANCFFLFLCRMLLALFAGFLAPSCPKLALVFGECL